MNNTTRRIQLGLVVSLLACVWACGAAMAAEKVYYLRADVTTVTMPDNTVIPMWGFAQDSAFGVEDGAVTVPGPLLTVDPGDSLKIVVQNKLTPDRTGLPMGCPVCIVIPGQPVTMTPVRFGPMPYPEYAGRIRSMTYEVPPGNTDETTSAYTWPDMKPGTFLYHSGTHVQCHVQMGLYGAVKKDAAPGEAYPGLAYDQDIVLLYSEIDPAFHQAVASANYGPGKMMTSTFDYNPRYFLINGRPFTSPYAEFPTVNPGANVLLRFVNAGLQTRVPTLNDPYFTLYAEDGNPYPHSREQYTILLPAGKTIDAMMNLPSGKAAIYDSVMGLTNAAASPGGMLTYIQTPQALAIVTQPASQTVATGSPVSFSIAASGSSPRSYQWRKDGADIPGATQATYGIAAAALSDVGGYSVVVSNPLNTVTSDSATLTVIEGVTITTQPLSQTVLVGTPVSFMVAATGDLPLSYQWQKGGVDIPGATADAYNITAAALPDAGNYTVIVSNAAGPVSSDPAVLAVTEPEPVAITMQPVSQTVMTLTAAVLEVAATGTAPLSYQWALGGVDIPGATGAAYNIPSVTLANQGTYTCKVSNPWSNAVSDPAVLTVTVSLADALDKTDLTWVVTGTAPWFGQTAVKHDGVDAARSGAIGHGQMSQLETTVTGPATLTFWWKVWSEQNHDFFRFSMDGVLQARISGNVFFIQRTLAIPAGTHVLRWRYSKDGSGTAGQDAAWIDQVVVTPTQ